MSTVRKKNLADAITASTGESRQAVSAVVEAFSDEPVDSPSKRQVRHRQWKLSIGQVLDWADAWYRNHRKWPVVNGGPIPYSGGSDWGLVDRALRNGRYGLALVTGGLPYFLADHRGAPLRQRARRALSVEQVLDWARRHRERTGFWPSTQGGRIVEAPGENWNAVDAALREGVRGFPGGSSLALLLKEHLGVEKKAERHIRLDLDEPMIIRWAREHLAKTGKWPSQKSGLIANPEAKGRNWSLVSQALTKGLCGLPGGSSLAKVLTKHRNIPEKSKRPPLAEDQIILWVKAYRQAHGRLPTSKAGQVLNERSLPVGTTWRAVDTALREGVRGLPGGQTLPGLLRQHFGRSIKREAPPLDERQVLRWALVHKGRTGRWPQAMTGPIPEAPGETWAGVILALQRGTRGLSKNGASFERLLKRLRAGGGQETRPA